METDKGKGMDRDRDTDRDRDKDTDVITVKPTLKSVSGAHFIIVSPQNHLNKSCFCRPSYGPKLIPYAYYLVWPSTLQWLNGQNRHFR
jgi:hypothetical protein